MLYFVAAHDKNFGMGYKGRLPWPRMGADIARLHALTKDKTVLMGERTYREYQNVKHAFSVGRIYVASRNLQRLPDAQVIQDLDEIRQKAKTQDIWAIGGGSIFQQLIGDVDSMYITEVDGAFEADTLFPEYQVSDWKVIQEEFFPPDADNPFAYTFLTLERKI